MQAEPRRTNASLSDFDNRVRFTVLGQGAKSDASIFICGDRARYARVLVGIAESVSTKERRLMWNSLAIARPSRIKARVEQILKSTCTLNPILSARRWATASLFALPCVWLATALQLQPASAQLAEHDDKPELSELEELVQKGRSVNTADAVKLEAHLKNRPDDLDARVHLIVYYFQQLLALPRLQHVLWLIEHHPESLLHKSRTAMILRMNNAFLAVDGDYEQAKRLWLGHLASPESTRRARENGINFLRQNHEWQLVEQMLIASRDADPENRIWRERLGHFYVEVLTLSEWPRFASGPKERWSEFFPPEQMAARVRTQLESSNDAVVIGVVGELLTESTRLSSPFHRPAPKERIYLGQKLLRRADVLEPDNVQWRESLAQLEKQ